MKKIAFYFNNLSLRGTTVATLDYAKYNKEILGNESILIYPNELLSHSFDQNYSKRFEIVKNFESEYITIGYNNKDEIIKKLDNLDCNFVYSLKAGFEDDVWFENKINLVHAVFNYYQPHGRYAYISEWLSSVASNSIIPCVPHIVNLPTDRTEDFRKKLNISNDKIVIGRHGGVDQFDFNFVKEAIDFIVNSDCSFVFIFVNTTKFIDHPSVFFIDPIIDLQEKTNFILSCDAMIHARSDGESFGLSICEFLFHNKPVISCGLGRDKNNIELLKNTDLIYHNKYELLDKIFKLKYKILCDDYRKIVEPFCPENVMKKFNEVFLF